MSSHFFYPTASGSLGEARRLGFKETLVKRELENATLNACNKPFDRAVRSKPGILIAEDTAGGASNTEAESLLGSRRKKLSRR